MRPVAYAVDELSDPCRPAQGDSSARLQPALTMTSPRLAHAAHPTSNRAIRPPRAGATAIQQREARRQREASFQATFDLAAVGIAHVAADGSWLRVNDRICAIVGYSREE